MRGRRLPSQDWLLRLVLGPRWAAEISSWKLSIISHRDNHHWLNSPAGQPDDSQDTSQEENAKSMSDTAISEYEARNIVSFDDSGLELPLSRVGWENNK